MGIRISFFKTPKHRVFNYVPRYYDPQTEQTDELRKKANNAETGVLGGENRTHHLRSRMHNGFQQAIYHNRKNTGNGKLMRIIVLVTIAVLLFALFYFTKMMEVLFSLLSR